MSGQKERKTVLVTGIISNYTSKINNYITPNKETFI